MTTAVEPTAKRERAQTAAKTSKPPLSGNQSHLMTGSSVRDHGANDSQVNSNIQTEFMPVDAFKVVLKKQQSAVDNVNSVKLFGHQGGPSSVKNASFERKNHPNYKSSSRVTHHVSGRHSQTLTGNLNFNGGTSTPKTHLGNQGPVQQSPRGTFIMTGGNRNAGNVGLKSDTTLDFGIPTTATTTQSDIFTRNNPSS